MFKRRLFLTFIAIIGLILSKLLWFEAGLGSKHLVFSAISIVGPMLGFICGFPEIIICSIFVFLMTFIAKGYIGFSIFYTLGLPTAAAAFSLKVSIEDKRSLSFLINVIVPIVCMVLFAMHNVGSEAVMYSFYWFIPMVIHFINGLLNARFSKYFLSALASTFVAHALGSIVYLYVMNTTPVIWNALIPVVAMERLAFSSVIVVTYFVIEFLISKIFSYNKSFQKIVIR